MPRFTRLLIPCWLAAALWGVSVQAQATEQVYRCGQSYQAEPCTGGQAVVVGDARDDAARREAQRVAQREAKAAQHPEFFFTLVESEPSISFGSCLRCT